MNHTTSAGQTDAVVRPLSTVRAALLIAAATLLIGLWNLEGPEFWWDEGWTLSVARNVVERGHYGRLLDGEPAPGRLEESPLVAGWALLAYLARPWVLQIVMLPVAGRTLHGTPVSGIYEVTALSVVSNSFTILSAVKRLCTLC